MQATWSVTGCEPMAAHRPWTNLRCLSLYVNHHQKGPKMPTSPPREPGGKRISSRPVVLELELERDRLIERAHRALSEAEAEIVDLRRQLNLAANGEPYRRVPGAGQAAMSSASGLDTATVSAAFDALERVATIKHLEDSDGTG